MAESEKKVNRNRDKFDPEVPIVNQIRTFQPYDKKLTKKRFRFDLLIFGGIPGRHQISE
jgi:hypothetical protein